MKDDLFKEKIFSYISKTWKVVKIPNQGRLPRKFLRKYPRIGGKLISAMKEEQKY